VAARGAGGGRGGVLLIKTFGNVLSFVRFKVAISAQLVCVDPTAVTWSTRLLEQPSSHAAGSTNASWALMAAYDGCPKQEEDKASPKPVCFARFLTACIVGIRPH
jgi:hypothetical protein